MKKRLVLKKNTVATLNRNEKAVILGGGIRTINPSCNRTCWGKTCVYPCQIP